MGEMEDENDIEITQLDDTKPQMDFYDAPSCDESIELFHNALFFCIRRPILHSAKVVAYLSLASLLINVVFVIIFGPQTAIHLVIEIIVLVVEFFCIIIVFYALSNREPNCLKPYLIFGLLWNLFLIILWIFCFAELLKAKDFAMKVLINFMDVLEMDIRSARRNASAGIWLAAFLIVGLGLTIAINFWFLHIILLAYFVLKCQRKQVWQTFNGDIKKCLIQQINSDEKKNHAVFL